MSAPSSMCIAPRPRPGDLRKDIEGIIAAHVFARFDAPDGVNLWWLYGEFKRDLSSNCGWDAPSHRYDQDLYDRAIAKYLNEVGL